MDQSLETTRDFGLEPYRAAHRALRGRYALLVVLILVGGAVGMAAGFHFSKPVYRTEGVVRIAFATAASDRETDQARKMAVFQEFMRTQEQVIASQRLASLAVEDPEWKKAGGGDSSEDATRFARHLSVEHVVGTEHLRVVYSDSDPVVAAMGVAAALRAYAILYENQGYEEGGDRLKALQSQAGDLQAQLQAVSQDLRQDTTDFATTEISQVYQKKMEEVAKLDAELTDIRVTLAVARHPYATSAVQDLSVNQIGMLDPRMRDYLDQQDAIAAQLSDATLRGELDQNQDVARLKQQAQMQEQRIDAYASEFRRFHKTNQPSQEKLTAPSDLEAQEAEVEKIYDSARQEMVSLGAKVNHISDEESKRDALSRKLDAVSRDIDDTKMEDALGGRLDIVSWGVVPAMPFQDSRAKAAAVGAAAGILAPAAVLVLIGLVHPRLRYADDAHALASEVSFLGMLPLVPSEALSQEQKALLGHCAHQVRVMLQVQSRGRRSSVYLISSSCAGDGKTLLTRALGLSFASSGVRTLLIDFDFIGQGLTRRLKMAGAGLRESLSESKLLSFVRATSCQNLYVLPCGGASRPQVAGLSPRAVARVLSLARENFEIVLVDSGPIVGSIEASTVAPEADGAILVVSRGQATPVIERAMSYIEAVGGKIVGVVFNRACRSDIERAGYSSSERSAGIEPAELAKHPAALEVESPISSY